MRSSQPLAAEEATSRWVRGRFLPWLELSCAGVKFSFLMKLQLLLVRQILSDTSSEAAYLYDSIVLVDHETDALVQNSLATVFSSCTIITVAHRLQTIMNADKIMVLDAGNLVEFDTPANLLKREDSAFKSLVDGSGDKEHLYSLVNPASTSSSSS